RQATPMRAEPQRATRRDRAQAAPGVASWSSPTRMIAPPAPTPAVLARWRQEAGDSLVWSIVAPAVLWGEKDWPLRDEKAAQTEIDRLVNVAKPLGARALLLRTPASIRPGTVAAKRFHAAASRMRKMTPVVVWEPGGLWEREDAKAFVQDLGIIVVSDPLRDKVAGEPVVYARMRGLGADRRYHQGRLEDLMIAVAHAEEVFVVFDTAQSFVEAGRMRKLIEGLAAAGDGADDEADAEEADDDAEDDADSDDDDADDVEDGEDPDADDGDEDGDGDGDDDDDDDADEDADEG
ncbi:MAG: DUF72 domain-containing protein, partial [Deltaproteobacteria bacterium]